MAKKQRLKPRKPPVLNDPYNPADEEEEEAFTPVTRSSKDLAREAADAEDRNADPFDDIDPSGDGDEREDAPVKKPRVSKDKNGKKTSKKEVSTHKRRVVTLDDRKLTKKEQEKLKGWKGMTRGAMLDAVFRGQAEAARQKFGHKSVYVGSEAKNLIIGIPCPSLAFEYLIAQDCFPLGLVMQLVAKHGVGKCLGRGTPVILADGRVIPVEQVQPGDRLMGMRGAVRTVLNVSTGYGPLYQVTPVKGETWICNEEHILTVVSCDTGEIKDISIRDWLAAQPTFRRRHMLFSVGVTQFEGAIRPLPVDPYFLGLWFGDGSKSTKTVLAGDVLRAIKLTNTDAEIVAACEQTAKDWGLYLHRYEYDYSLSSEEKGGYRNAKVNRLLTSLRDLVGPEVRIPEIYLRASEQDRLAFLAGYIDTDGELRNGCFVVTQKREDWARAIWWLARSLGFCATIREQQKSCALASGAIFTGTYHTVIISGGLERVPTRLARKQARPRKQRKTATRTNFKVTPIGRGNYYGFMLDGDHRFLLGDFTVTHNSGLAAEFGRWFNMAGGGMVLCENETKFNPEWYESIMGSTAWNRLELYRCSSVEDWQRKMTFAVKDMQNRLTGTKEDPGPGRTVPVLLCVDSIMGKQSEETQEKIFGKVGKKGKHGTTGEGFAGRGYPIEAQSITRYMRTLPGKIDDWPFACVLINHLRIKTDDMGNQERNKAGGEQVNFQESFELELKKVGGHKKRIECADFEGFPVAISCEKNSFGPTHRQIQSRILWWEEQNEETGDWYQNTVWDWDWSTVWLLNHLLNGEKANPRLKASLQEIDFHIKCPSVSDIENSAYSRSLGMKEKDAVTWSELGALIREDRDLMARLRVALRINNRPLLAGDYLEQLDALKEKLP